VVDYQGRRDSANMFRSTDARKAHSWQSHALFLLVVAFAFSSPAWGDVAFAIAPCPTTATPLEPTFEPPTSPTNGCTVGDLQFSNFAVGTDAGATINGVLLGSNNVAVPDGTSVTLSTAPGGYGIELAPIPVNNPTPTGFCATNSGSAGWCINGANLSLASDVTYQVNALNGSTLNFIDILATVGLHTNASGAGATAVVFREFCLGTSTFTVDASGTSTCAPANYGVLQVGALNFTGNLNGQNTYVSASLGTGFAPTSVIAVRDTVYLVTPNGNGSWAAIESFDFVTPEPATFGMIGGGLIGLGLLTWRRKRKVA
jgi:hypothetical protein